jgi:hypothetical protein
MKHALLALLLCLLPMSLAQSDSPSDMQDSGNGFLRICEVSTHGETSAHGLECAVWISGVFEGLDAYNATSKTQLYEIPESLTMGQVAKIAVKYMNDHPKMLNVRTSKLVLYALMDAYPVKKK